MDIFTVWDLQTLIESQSGPCVSLYMPIHTRGYNEEQDPIRFRNLLREAEERLMAQGLRTPDVRAILGPAEALLQDPLFWSSGGDGLALFASPGQFHSYRLALDLAELVVVASRFHVKPLMPFLASDGHYYILALSQKQVRLLEATRHTVDQLDPTGSLPSLAEALQFEQYERQLQYHTGTSSGYGRRPASYHGTDPSDEAKDRILRWFRRIDEELAEFLKGGQSPLVLAGVEFLFSLYREANTYGNLLADGVHGNPEELRPEELHAGAWPLVEPIFSADREAAAARYGQLAGTGRTTTDPAEALVAAQHGRVDTLFVPVGTQVWGRYDVDGDVVEVHHEPEVADGDLLDLAALLTLQRSGMVYALPAEQVPGGGVLAAVLRY
ncbi:MAG: hypothetical protein R6X16_07330 [Anaerolineae bacterium]